MSNLKRPTRALLVVVLPVLLVGLAYGLELAGQCAPTAPLGLLCEILGFGAVFAGLAAFGAGIQLIVSKGVDRRYRLAAAAVLLGYVAWFVFYAMA